MKIIKPLSIILSSYILTACNGSSGKNEVPTVPDPAAPYVMSISVLDENCQVLETVSQVAGGTFCIHALLSQDNHPVSNTTVNFSTPLGSISPESTITNAAGIAEAKLSSTVFQYGASTLTAISSLATGNASFEFTKPDVLPPDPNAELTLVVTVKDNQCQSIETPTAFAGETFCVESAVSRDGIPVEQQTVTFSTTLGELSPATALSNSDGIATIQLLSSVSEIGAGDITASANAQSGSASFEFLRDPEQGSDTPLLSLSSYLGSIATNTVKQGEVLTLQAKLVDRTNQPLVNQRINFNAEIGELNGESWLTNEQGVASALLTLPEQSILGAAIATASFQLNENTLVTTPINYQVLRADDIEAPIVKAGYFNENNEFIENQLAVSLERQQDGSVNLAAGGTLGVSLLLVDGNEQVITTPTAISFSSSCVINNKANIDEQVLTINGEANATYQDINCAGSSGNQDQIVATLSVNGETIILTQDINLSGEALGAIEFVSAEPDSIVLKGTGGVGRQEVSTITFRVKGKQGNLLAQQRVNFSASTEVGGLEVSPSSAFTNSQGEVSTKVIAGTVPTPVRVTASATTTKDDGSEIEIISQSDLLSVNTGLADQNSMSIAAEVLNPETNNINGVKTQITVWLADSFNNPVPDGTTVNFTTEGGKIDPSCQTTNGVCSVTWESAEPRVFNHRATILATALGHETFFDTNGNNLFDENDGDALVAPNVSSGFGRTEYQPEGFIDMSEAWRDDNENGQYDSGEVFIDFDNDKEFAPADNRFNGPQCSAKCGSSNAINVRKALRLIMASGASNWSLYEEQEVLPGLFEREIVASNRDPIDSFRTPITRGASQSYSLLFGDTALQTLPLGSTIDITTDSGELVGQTSFTVGNTIGTGFAVTQAELDSQITLLDALAQGVFGGQQIRFSLKNTLGDGEAATTANLELTITSPGGVVTSGLITVVLE